MKTKEDDSIRRNQQIHHSIINLLPLGRGFAIISSQPALLMPLADPWPQMNKGSCLYVYTIHIHHDDVHRLLILNNVLHLLIALSSAFWERQTHWLNSSACDVTTMPVLVVLTMNVTQNITPRKPRLDPLLVTALDTKLDPTPVSACIYCLQSLIW